MIRIRIVQTPTLESIDGLQLDRFELGRVYEVGPLLGSLLLAEGWAEPVADDGPVPVVAAEAAVAAVAIDPDNPPNLRREVYPPYLDRLELDLVADLERRQRAKHRTAAARNSDRPPPLRRKDDRRR